VTRMPVSGTLESISPPNTRSRLARAPSHARQVTRSRCLPASLAAGLVGLRATKLARPASRWAEAVGTRIAHPTRLPRRRMQPAGAAGRPRAPCAGRASSGTLSHLLTAPRPPPPPPSTHRLCPTRCPHRGGSGGGGVAAPPAAQMSSTPSIPIAPRGGGVAANGANAATAAPAVGAAGNGTGPALTGTMGAGAGGAANGHAAGASWSLQFEGGGRRRWCDFRPPTTPCLQHRRRRPLRRCHLNGGWRPSTPPCWLPWWSAQTSESASPSLCHLCDRSASPPRRMCRDVMVMDRSLTTVDRQDPSDPATMQQV